MSEYRILKTVNAPIKRKNKPIIYIKKHMVLENKKSKEKYAIFEFVNNYKEDINSFTVLIGQFDINGKLINKNRVPYNDLKIKSFSKFVPFFKLGLDKDTDNVKVIIVEADFTEHFYKNGVILPKDELKEKSLNLEDGLVKNYNAKKLAKPFKTPLKLGILALAITTLFIFAFGLKNRTIISDNFKFNTLTNEIISYTGSDSNVIIPEKIGNREVKSIGSRAFYNTNINQVQIDAKNITSIGSYAFANCQNLHNVYCVNGSVNTIDSHAFENCKNLNSVYIKNLKSVKDYAFNNCSSLLSFESDTVEYIGNYCFNGCKNLMTVDCKNAYLLNRIFDKNCTKLLSVTFNSVSNDGITLKSIFYELDLPNLEVNTYTDYVFDGFISDNFRLSKLNFLNPNVEFISYYEYDKWVNLAINEGKFTNNSSYEKVFDCVVNLYANDSIINSGIFYTSDEYKVILNSALGNIANYVNELHINSIMNVTYEFLEPFINVEALYVGEMCSIEDYSIPFSNLKYIEMPVRNNRFYNLFALLPVDDIDVKISGGDVIDEKYFESANFIKSLYITNVSSVGKNAIYDCGDLEKLIITNSVSEFTLPVIGGDAYNLRYVEIPFVGVTYNEPKSYQEFNTCAAMTEELYITSTNLKVKENAFKNTASLTKLVIKNGINESVKLGIDCDVLLIIKTDGNTDLYKLYNSMYIERLCLIGNTNGPKTFNSSLLIIENLYLYNFDSYYTINQDIGIIYYNNTSDISMFNNHGNIEIVYDMEETLGGFSLR